MQAVRILGPLLIYCFSSTGWGAWTQSHLKPPKAKVSALAEVSTGFLLGQGLLAAVWLLLGLVHQFKLSIVLPVLSIGILLLLKLRVTGAIAAFEIKEHFKQIRRESWPWQLLAASVVLWALYGIVSVARPLSGDSMFFHLVIPKVMAASHRLTLYGFSPTMASLGLLGEMHYALLALLGSLEAAQLSSWPTYLVCGIILGSSLKILGARTRGVWIGLVALFSSTAALNWVGEGKVEIFPCAMALAAFFWALAVQLTPTRRSAFLIGLFSGFAILGKLSYLLTFLPGICVLIGWPWLGKIKIINKKIISFEIGFLVRQTFAFLWGTILVLIPNILKNKVFLGDPLAPFLPRGGKYFSWINEAWYLPETIRHIKIFYPFALTFGQYFAEYGNLSPLVLAFLPLSLLLPRPADFRQSRVVPVTLAAWIPIFLYACTSPDKLVTRYFLAALVMCIPLAAISAEAALFSFRSKWVDGIILSACFLTLISVIDWSQSYIFSASDALDVFKRGNQHCEMNPGWCEVMEPINLQAAEGSRVLSSTEYIYFLRPDLIQCAGLNSAVAELFSEKTAEKRLLKLREMGFTYLIVDLGTGSGLQLRDFLSTVPPAGVKIEKIYEKNKLSAFKLEFNDDLPKFRESSPLACVQHGGAWELH